MLINSIHSIRINLQATYIRRIKRALAGFLVGNMIFGTLIGCAVLWGCFVDCQVMFYGISTHEEVLEASLFEPQDQIRKIGEALVYIIASLQEISLISFQIGCLMAVFGFIIPADASRYNPVLLPDTNSDRTKS